MADEVIMGSQVPSAGGGDREVMKAFDTCSPKRGTYCHSVNRRGVYPPIGIQN